MTNSRKEATPTKPATKSADPGRAVQVLIVDDHQVVHWGLKLMLSRLPWVGRCFSAQTAEEAITIASKHRPEVAVVDLFVGQESGPEICEQLHIARPGMRILLISGAGRISPSAAAACGASGFVTKDAPGIDIVRAVRDVAVGGSTFRDPQGTGSSGPDLSERERQVLALVVTGATNREIARQLHLSPHTVKEYVSAVYRKLEVRNRAEAVQRASSLGLGV
jgi:DNA-binding NarL/FixJ family response regulator